MEEIEVMKIAEVKKLPNGVNGITIEGTITKTPGTPRDSEYGWSQMIVLQDDTADMSSWINIESAEDAYKVGQCIKVTGKVSKYVKGGKPGISLNNGKVIEEIVREEDVSQEQPKETREKTGEKTGQPIQAYMSSDNYWREKSFRDIENNKCIVRECAIKAATEFLAGSTANIRSLEVQKWYFEFTDKIVDYINDVKNKEITSEAITKEFGGTATEEKEETKEERIEKAKDIVKDAEGEDIIKNPHLTEPINDKMATVKQKKQIYGYINEEGKKIGGMVNSDYIETKEIENIGKPANLTKANGIRYWEYWYGKDEELGERDKRELEENEKKQKESPFVTESKPLEKRDPKDDASLNKDLLIENIHKLREKQYLTDDTKFKKAFDCNTNFDRWTEKDLIRMKEKLEMYNPL